MKIRIIEILFSTTFSIITSCNAYSEPWTKLQLRPWLSIELPTGWQVNSPEFNGMVAAWMETQGLSGREAAKSFSASLTLPELKRSIASMNVRFYPEKKLSQSDAKEICKTELNKYDQLLHEQLSKGLNGKNGLKLLSWFETECRDINSTITLTSSYHRRVEFPIKVDGHVRLVRVFNGSKSFTLTVSYDIEFEPIIKPICENIISSMLVDK